ncbi:hypothetical protein MNBD_ALPHA08-1145 [hydrothermal vent metagenome]|uniref:LPS export ABC transporter periplasmic protein LptC n=1 Tax=hydrothermal vent metagenome TaxID=652676 RepID=A0A3B0SDI7_9ZZZZ
MKPAPVKPLKRPVRAATVISWLVLSATVLLLAVFAVKAGMFASLFGRKPEPVVNMPLPDQVSSGVSSITGFDKGGQPYKLTSQSVLQDKNNSDLAHLKQISGILRKKTGKKLLLNALGGQYNADKKILDLEGKIKLVSQGEYTAYLEKARVTLKEKRLYAKVPVTVIFDRGTIQANGIDISDNGNRVLFFDGVKTRFDAESAPVSGEKVDRKGN